ncbi:Ribonuclease H-like protein [Gracilaria domingensis]|nr:Ribonuclease H-like protein [Gracilaria domingensis]
MAEFIFVLAEVRRVARQLEADKKVTLSRAPRLLRELYETLSIMAGEMHTTDANDVGLYYDPFDETSVDNQIHHAISPRLSTANADEERDEARKCILQKQHSKNLAVCLAQRIKERLGSIWKRVSEDVAIWLPTAQSGAENILSSSLPASQTPYPEMRAPRRVLLFHIAALLDINECGFDFLDCTQSEKEQYKEIIMNAVIREAIELDSSLSNYGDSLRAVLKLFCGGMYSELQSCGRREPTMALKFWELANERTGIVSPVPFNRVARAAHSAQASSASAERLFSDLGRLEGHQRQSLLTSTLEMTEIIKAFVMGEIHSWKRSTTLCFAFYGDGFS